MSDPKLPSPDEISFGDALAELDQVVAGLESGQLELEESLVRYERGVALVRALQAKLADAQQRVSMLIGELEAADEPQSEPAPADTDSTAGTEVAF
jgi:exodeoxyribonuclease VII small subunit